jgi:hypothetical protein
MATHKLLTLEDTVLLTLATNPNFVREFPFLASGAAPVAKKSCKPCNKAAARRVQTMQTIKQSIINMGVEKKKRLKEMLSADKVRLRVAQNGKVVEYTF